jgi:excisionase family DNA binding protein
MKAIICTSNQATMNTSEPAGQIGTAGPLPPTLVKKKELAKRLSVSTRTIDTWVAKRVIPYLQVTPRFYLFHFDEVLAAIRKHYQIEPVSRE